MKAYMDLVHSFVYEEDNEINILIETEVCIYHYISVNKNLSSNLNL